MIDPAANQPYRISPSMRGSRCWACWTLVLLLTLLLLSILSLDLEVRVIFQADSLRRLASFVGELFPPNVSPDFLERIFHASLETLAMSALGTLLAMLFGLILAVLRHPVTSILLNVLRAIPDLVWAALLLISAGLGPFAGTLALALHTTGVLGRLFSEALENAPRHPEETLRVLGASRAQRFFYATLVQVMPQLMAYSLYRWENNIRAATVLGVVGAGGLGQMLMVHMSLFQMSSMSTVLLAMLALVLLVDQLSARLRRALQ